MSTSPRIKTIYTDGACSGNPGPGGWGTVVYFEDGSVHEMGGAAAQTTNNRMEIQAAIAALDYLLASGETQPVSLYTDSEYVKNGITKWVTGWKRKGWKTSSGAAVLNQDLWETLDRLNQKVMRQTTLQWQYVRGHSGDVGNDRCDTIARGFSLSSPPALRQQTNGAAASSLTNSAIDSATGDLEEELASASVATSDSSPLPPSSSSLESASYITNSPSSEAIQSKHGTTATETIMVNSTSSTLNDASDLPREVRVAQLRNMVETLQIADEIAAKGYLITSAELADLMDVNASAVTSRGDNWVWRNWVVSRVRREGNQILWQLERVD
ncbi:ribonuclease HI [Phormidium tenue FACHB-886]|nr:ribonuclease HI [Phormidium tenue FACHB-886]